MTITLKEELHLNRMNRASQDVLLGTLIKNIFSTSGSSYKNKFNRVNTSINYTLNYIDDICFVSGSPTITLPTAVGFDRVPYYIKNIGNSNASIISLGGTIEGETSQTLYPHDSIALSSDNTNWWII